MNSRVSQRVAVIGLGRFGMALARRLSQHGAEVIAIDRQHKLIDEICNDVAIAVRLDSTEESALRSQEVERVHSVVVAIGENFEAALLTTVICKKTLKVPNVICRAQTPLHAEIFEQIGADEVIQPEQTAGEMLGRRLAHPRIHDYVKLGDGFTVVELQAPSRFVGKTLKEIDLRSTYRVNLIAIRRKAETSDAEPPQGSDQLISVPGPDDRIQAADILLLSGSDAALSNLPQG
ncbi:MAG: TrkA family potassium uptake protein [Fuerstiella sp.]|nr:TrkA family potassium uptake protein [Fuerstiella sp.]MCP4858088.1 TrkA family potassium uptake protein [Fuerstiella sp.]